MTRDERMDALREIIDALGAMGYPRAVRAVVAELTREYGAVMPEPSTRPEAWERHLDEHRLEQAQRAGSTAA